MKPKVVVFFCNWSNYPGLQLSYPHIGPPPEQKMMVSMCSGRISPELILESFSRGAWGVFITACPVEKCEHDANYKTWGRIHLLKKMLPDMGIEEDRLKIEWIDKGEAAVFKKALDDFTKELEELGEPSLKIPKANAA